MKYLLFFLLFSTVSALNSAVQQFTHRNVLLAPQIYKQLIQDEEGNFMFSPLSLELALAFTASGCNGTSLDELLSFLLPDSNKEFLESAVQSLMVQLVSGDFTFDIANKIYTAKDLTVCPNFKQTAVNVYKAEAQSIDFGDQQEAADTINTWVEEHTDNKIQHLISPSDLGPNTAALLINALYFQANWSNTFSPHKTEEAIFSSNQGILKVDMMHQEGFFDYTDCGNLGPQFLKLPLGGGGASMIIILPNEKNGLEKLSADRIFTPQVLTSRFVKVGLPKFLIESSFGLVDLLQQFGVQSIFNAADADLSGIAGEPGDLVVSDVLQKTYMKLDESGIEAAAATGVSVVLTAVLPPDEAVSFIVDHPFAFYIEIEGIIVFMGKITSPKM